MSKGSGSNLYNFRHGSRPTGKDRDYRENPGQGSRILIWQDIYG